MRAIGGSARIGSRSHDPLGNPHQFYRKGAIGSKQFGLAVRSARRVGSIRLFSPIPSQETGFLSEFWLWNQSDFQKPGFSMSGRKPFALGPRGWILTKTNQFLPNLLFSKIILENNKKIIANFSQTVDGSMGVLVQFTKRHPRGSCVQSPNQRLQPLFLREISGFSRKNEIPRRTNFSSPRGRGLTKLLICALRRDAIAKLPPNCPYFPLTNPPT